MLRFEIFDLPRINKIQFLWHTNLMCRASKKSRVSDAGPFSELPRKARRRPALVDYWMFCTDTNVPTMSSRILPQCHPQSLGACVEPKVLHDVERLHQAKHVTNFLPTDGRTKSLVRARPLLLWCRHKVRAPLAVLRRHTLPRGWTVAFGRCGALAVAGWLGDSRAGPSRRRLGIRGPVSRPARLAQVRSVLLWRCVELRAQRNRLGPRRDSRA